MLVESLLLLAVLNIAGALQCSDDPLSKFRLSQIPLTEQSYLADTPPSKTNTTWYFNLCQAEGQLPEECPKNSQICGIQRVLLPGQDSIATQVVSWGQGLNYYVKLLQSTTKANIHIKMGENGWGSNTVDASMDLICSKVEELRVSWDQKLLEVTWYSPYACLSDEKDIPPPPPDEKQPGDKEPDDKEPEEPADDSWGWFTWLFIILVLGFGAYIIMGAWVTYSKSPADFSDAVHDFTDTLKNIAKGIPGFIGEILERIMGRTDRGGYSAV